MAYLMLLVVVLNLYANNMYPTMRYLKAPGLPCAGEVPRFENFVIKKEV